MFEGKEVKVILAQAGSGKTTKLLELIAEELKTRRPEELAFVTFTKKGAEEGLVRMCNKYRLTPDDLPYFRTLHSLTFHALNFTQKQIMNKLDERLFNREYGYNLNRNELQQSNTPQSKEARYLDYYDLERSGALTSAMRVKSDIEVNYYETLTKCYDTFKKEHDLVDFFDCLLQYEAKGEPLPCKVVFVDEAQDISTLQWKIIAKAFCNAEKIYIAGDDCQALFSYSGARPDILIHLSKQYPVEYLKESYRIPKKVYELAKGVTSFIQEKTIKPFDFHEGNIEGNIRQLPNTDFLGKYIDVANLTNKRTCDWYLLARNKCYFKAYTSFLEENLIPYWTTDGFFMGGQIMSRLKDYHNFGKKGYKTEAKKKEFMLKYNLKNMNVPFTETNIFTEDRKWVYNAYIERYGLQKLADMCKWTPQILVSTIHAVKGGEADNVSILLSATNKTSSGIQEDMDAELRVLYVGITRTKKNLYFIDSSNCKAYDSILNIVKDQYGIDW